MRQFPTTTVAILAAFLTTFIYSSRVMAQQVCAPPFDNCKQTVRLSKTFKKRKKPVSSPSTFYVGPGIYVLEGLKGEMGYGGSLGYAIRLNRNTPVYFGMDIGYSRWNVELEKTVGEGENQTTVSEYEPLSSLQLMASIYYRFMDNPYSKAHPYIGLSLGPTLLSGKESIKIGEEALGGSATQVKLLLLFRPGVEINITKEVGIGIEPKFGILSSHFIFAPTVNAVFSF